jgi:hypothetical protein
MEVISALRVASIMFLSVVVLMGWLAGNMHQLAHRQWGERQWEQPLICSIWHLLK